MTTALSPVFPPAQTRMIDSTNAACAKSHACERKREHVFLSEAVHCTDGPPHKQEDEQHSKQPSAIRVPRVWSQAFNSSCQSTGGQPPPWARCQKTRTTVAGRLSDRLAYIILRSLYDTRSCLLTTMCSLGQFNSLKACKHGHFCTLRWVSPP